MGSERVVLKIFLNWTMLKCALRAQETSEEELGLEPDPPEPPSSDGEAGSVPHGPA